MFNRWSRLFKGSFLKDRDNNKAILNIEFYTVCTADQLGLQAQSHSYPLDFKAPIFKVTESTPLQELEIV